MHIYGGLLTAPWLVGGFVLAGLLVLVASWRVRDEEIPRIAVLTAVFFVASLIHVRLGPTSVHLVLSGLLGVVLGWRAPLAVLVGLTLQAALFGHGDLAALGVNTCVMSVPALGAAWLFGPLHRLAWLRRPWFRGGLVLLAALIWELSLVFGVVLLATNPLRLLVVVVHPGSGRPPQLALPDFGPATHVALHPLTLALAVLVALALSFWEARQRHAPEFALGLFLGIVTMLATLVLNGVVLIGGGFEALHNWVVVVLLAHLPLAVIEGLILGFTVAFLARVKPELLRPMRNERQEDAAKGENADGLSGAAASPLAVPHTPLKTILLAVLGTLLFARPALAHRLEGECRVLPGGKVQVESWFETGDTPRKATVKVYCSDGRLLTEGPLDEESGKFLFSYDEPDNLKIVIDAPGGHRKELTLSRKELQDASPPPPAEAPSLPRDVMAAVALLLGLAALVLSMRNARRLTRLQQEIRSAPSPAPEEPPQVNGPVRAPEERFTTG
jgi:cobalt/nickel transport system permease protein